VVIADYGGSRWNWRVLDDDWPSRQFSLNRKSSRHDFAPSFFLSEAFVISAFGDIFIRLLTDWQLSSFALMEARLYVRDARLICYRRLNIKQ
jgi:hypothetical protein